MKQLRSKVSGTIFDVTAEIEGWYWILVPKEGQKTVPLTVAKTNPNYEEFVRRPVVGDIWEGGSQKYRVIGIDEVNNLAFWVIASEFYGGEYPTLKPGQVQYAGNDSDKDVFVFIRQLDEETLKFVRGFVRGLDG